MSDTQSESTEPLPDDEAELLRAQVDEHADELVQLLDLLEATEGLAEDLTPQLVEVARENRSDIEALRMAFEREETLVLLQKLGNNSETLIELLDVLDASSGLVEDLVPEVVTVMRENRADVERLRMAFEREETLVLLERVGERSEDLVDLLDLLEATKGLAEELVPELVDTARDTRGSIEDLRMAVEGFADARRERDREVDMYELGRNMENLAALGETLAQPEVSNSLNAGLSAFADEQPKRLGFWGLVRAMRDPAVQESLGRLVEAARRMSRGR